MNYKQRTIELTPKRDDDGTWDCPYHILDFRATCWGHQKGTTRGGFPSRHTAVAAALAEAKRIIDTFPPPAPNTPSRLPLSFETYADKVRRLFTRPGE
jgi:hypothetical protein